MTNAMLSANEKLIEGAPMHAVSSIMSILTLVSLCHAQDISLSGVVTDSAGTGIEGATVALVAAGITTTTDAHGSFILSSEPTGVTTAGAGASRSAAPFVIDKNTVTFELSRETTLALRMYTPGGELLFARSGPMPPGMHSIELPRGGRGLRIYDITVDGERFTAKRLRMRGAASIGCGDVATGGALSKRAAPLAPLADVLSVIKDGWLPYRDSTRNADTCGIVIEMVPCAGTVSDTDGNVYNTVRIGAQEWTVENLRTTRLYDGTPIPHVTDSAAWNGLSSPGYCFHDNTTDSVAQSRHGALYNWYAVNTGKLAPSGWRVPAEADWNELNNYLADNGYSFDGTIGADEVASSLGARTGWTASSDPGDVGNDASSNNTTGFSGLASSFRGNHGAFSRQGNCGYFWTTTEAYGSEAYFRYLHHGLPRLERSDRDWRYGFSVRVVRDVSPE